ncbi:MAG: hypothetical protein V1856_00490 [Candidatus Liptonbacteria bacterium]
MTEVLFSKEFIVWLPRIFWSAACLWAAWLYLRRDKINLPRNIWYLIWLGLLFAAGYTLLLTFAQYDLWSRDQFTRAFLESPLPDETPMPEYLRRLPVFQGGSGYFVFYAFGRFWLRTLIGMFASFLLWLFLRSLRKYRGRFFEEGETELGFWAGLAAGWPGIIALVLMVFPGTVLISVSRRVFLKEELTTLGWPFIICGFLAFWFGKFIISALGLGVLFI